MIVQQGSFAPRWVIVSTVVAAVSERAPYRDRLGLLGTWEGAGTRGWLRNIYPPSRRTVKVAHGVPVG